MVRQICLSVSMWRANGNPRPNPKIEEILHEHPHLSREGSGEVLTLACTPGGPETLKAEETFLKTVCKKTCSSCLKDSNGKFEPQSDLPPQQVLRGVSKNYKS